MLTFIPECLVIIVNVYVEALHIEKIDPDKIGFITHFIRIFFLDLGFI